jgi:hypothetical protein
LQGLPPPGYDRGDQFPEEKGSDMPTNLTAILKDEPGQLASLGEATGMAGVSIELFYTPFRSVRIVMATDDLDSASSALD